MVAPARLPSLRLPQTERPYRWSVILSIALHVGVVFLFVRHELASPDAHADVEVRTPGTPGKRGGGGGDTFRIELPPYQEPARAEAPPPPVPTPVPQVVTKPTIKIQKLDAPQTGTVTSSVDISSLAGVGPGSGGGAGTGAGGGVGVDTGAGRGGEGGDVFPPTPRYAILPPLPAPASVRGRTIRVHFSVDQQGRVTKVQVEPEIKDAGYRQQFLSMMKEYAFNPAHRVDGTAVAGELVIPIGL